jgi:hypothetical protein
MMLNLEEAAKFVGMPPERLHATVWGKLGPKTNGSYWSPMFDADELRRWKQDNVPYVPIPEGRKIGTKAIYRHRQSR